METITIKAKKGIRQYPGYMTTQLTIPANQKWVKDSYFNELPLTDNFVNYWTVVTGLDTKNPNCPLYDCDVEFEILNNSTALVYINDIEEIKDLELIDIADMLKHPALDNLIMLDISKQGNVLGVIRITEIRTPSNIDCQVVDLFKPTAPAHEDFSLEGITGTTFQDMSYIGNNTVYVSGEPAKEIWQQALGLVVGHYGLDKNYKPKNKYKFCISDYNNKEAETKEILDQFIALTT